MKFLSLGAGVQSSVMLMMAIQGELEKPDHVIFADTGFEPRRVYEHVAWCKKQCEKAGIPFHQVKAKLNMREEFHEMEKGKRFTLSKGPPFYMDYGNTRGISKRQCTRDAKIKPLIRKELKLLGHKTARTALHGEALVMIGISTDEARRAHPSREKWIDNIYPLIDPLKMSRSDCQAWWEQNYPHINLPSSSCTICPYRSDKMWKSMKDNDPEDWHEAVEYDERFRQAYLHKKMLLVIENRSLFI